MVGPRRSVMDRCIRTFRRSPNENPIHPPEPLCLRVLVSKATLETFTLESFAVLALMEVRIQVARDHDRHIPRVLSSIGERLFHLPHASGDGTALQVEIVDNHQ